MHPDYPAWLEAHYSNEGTRNTQIYRIGRVEDVYGDLGDHFRDGTYEQIISSLKYSRDDEHQNKPNPSRIQFDGNIHNNLQSYKSAVVRYKRFLNDSDFQKNVESERQNDADVFPGMEESARQRFALERDMQEALRRNIGSLDPSLNILDDGAERAVNSGLIDITCDDGVSIVVVELKAGKADSRAIGQILGYMGDIQEEEGGKPVRGILVAHDFDKRAKAAARVVPTLTLKKYAIEFKFTSED